MRAAGVVFSTSMARGILFEDEAKERNQSPHVSRWVRADQMLPRGLRFELDLGSVLNVNDFMTAKSDEVLDLVANTCKGDWWWSTEERPIIEDVLWSQATSKTVKPEDDYVLPMPVDQRRFLILYFDSRDDAMLVRLTVPDLKALRDENSGELPQDS